jgi:hypothetical protein
MILAALKKTFQSVVQLTETGASNSLQNTDESKLRLQDSMLILSASLEELNIEANNLADTYLPNVSSYFKSLEIPSLEDFLNNYGVTRAAKGSIRFTKNTVKAVLDDLHYQTQLLQDLIENFAKWDIESPLHKFSVQLLRLLLEVAGLKLLFSVAVGLTAYAYAFAILMLSFLALTIMISAVGVYAYVGIKKTLDACIALGNYLDAVDNSKNNPEV